MALNPNQMQALFQSQSDGQQSAFIAATPGMSDEERNRWVNQYGVGGTGYGDYLNWYGNGKQYEGSGSTAATTGWTGQTTGTFATGSSPDPDGVKAATTLGAIAKAPGMTGATTTPKAVGTGVGMAAALGGNTAQPVNPHPQTPSSLGMATGSAVPGPTTPGPRNQNTNPSSPIGPGASNPNNPGSGTPGAPGAPGTTNPTLGQVGKWTAPTRPRVTTGSIDDYMDDEGYAFRLKEGTDAMQNSRAAMGGLNSGATLKGVGRYASGLASDEIAKAYARMQDARNFDENQSRDERDFSRGVYTGDRTFDEDSRRNNRDYDEDTRRNDRDFSESGRRFDTGTGQWEKNFAFNTDNVNREFDYKTATGDRDFNEKHNLSLADLGLRGNQSNSQLALGLAQIYGNNTLTGAGAGAAGTTAGANNFNNFITEILKTLNGNTVVNTAKP